MQVNHSAGISTVYLLLLFMFFYSLFNFNRRLQDLTSIA